MDQIREVGDLEIGLDVLGEYAPEWDVWARPPVPQISAALLGILPRHGGQDFQRPTVAVEVSRCRAVPSSEIAHELVGIHRVFNGGGPRLVSAAATGPQGG